MKKFSPKFLMVLIALLIPSFTFAQVKFLTEGFEEGIPNNWQNVPGQGAVSWVIQENDDLTNPKPAGAYKGDKRVAFAPKATPRDAKLITPVVNLSSASEKRVLAFHYATEASVSGIDILRVYLRESADKEWDLIETYQDEKKAWTEAVIEINSGWESVQVAFEGVGGLGNGIVLDEIWIGNKLLCEEITGIEVISVSYNLATVRWNDNPDATYRVKLSKTQITDPQDENDDILPSSAYCTFPNLDPQTTYYFYIKGVCGEEEDSDDVTDWFEGIFRTPCAPETELSEDFESYSSNNFGDGCWTIGARDSNDNPVTSNQPSVSTNGTYSHSGTKSLKIEGSYDYTSATPYIYSFAVTPPIDNSIDLQTKQLDFWMYADNKKSELHIGIANSTDLSGYQLIEVVTCENIKTVENKTVHLNEYTGVGRYIVFIVSGEQVGGTTTVYIDDVELQDISECESLRISNIGVTTTDNSAEIKWNAVNSNSWNVKVSSKSISPTNQNGDIANYQNTTNNPLNVPGLSPSTPYFVYIQAVCEGGILGPWSEEKTFITGCYPSGITDFPYKESFDIWGTTKEGMHNSFPACWDRIQYFRSSQWYPYINADVYYSAPGALYLYSINASTPSMAITPPMGVEIDKLQIQFMARSTSTSYELKVGTMPAQSQNISDFELLHTVKVSSSNTWQQINLKLNESNVPNNRCIAFLSNRSSTNNFYIDDLIIEEIALCDESVNLKLIDKSSSTVSLNWDSPSNGTAWEIAYGEQGFNPYTDTFESKIFNNSPSGIIDELNSNTYYDFYVRTKCDDLNGSNWRGPVTVLTLQKPKTEGIPGCIDLDDVSEIREWTLLNGDNANKWYISSSISNDGSNKLFISADGTDNNYTNKQSHVFAYRTIGFETGGLYDVNFKWLCEGAGNNDYLRVFWVPENIDIIADSNNGITNATTTPEGWEEVSNGQLNQNDDWQSFMGTVVVPSASNYNLVLYWTNSSTTANNNLAAAIDEICISVNTDCMTPTLSTVTKVLDTSAELNFVGFNTNTWNLKVSATDIWPNMGTTVEIEEDIHSTTHPITGLQPTTTYFYYIKADCDTEWKERGTFTTKCTPAGIPFDEGFEDENSFYSCWNIYTPFSLDMDDEEVICMPLYGRMVGYPAYQGNNLLYFGNIDFDGNKRYIYASTPPLNVTSFEGLQASFYAQNPNGSAAGSMTLGIMEDPDRPESFYKIETVSPGRGWTNFIVPLDKYEGEGKYFTFYTDDTFLLIDSLRIEEIPQCRDINMGKVSEEDITTTSATLTWEGYMPTYHIKVSFNPILNVEETAYVFDGVVDKPFLELENLRPNCEYYWTVRSVCDEFPDATPLWSDVRKFRTGCPETFSIPLYESFDTHGVSSRLRPNCWTVVANEGNTANEINQQYYNSLPGSMRMQCSRYDMTTFISPKLDVDDIRDLAVTFQGFVYTSDQWMFVGIMSDPENPDSFEKIDSIRYAGGDFEFKQYTFNFSKATNNGKYVAFRLELPLNNYAATSAYIDDLVINYHNPSCKEATDIKANSVTENSAVLTWYQSGITASYNIKISTHPIDPQREEGTQQDIEGVQITDYEEYKLTDLIENTTYYVYLQSVCGGNEKSVWSEACVFQTSCPPVDLLFTEYFETYGGSGAGYFPSCWRNYALASGKMSNPNSNFISPYIIEMKETERFSAEHPNALRMSPHWDAKGYSTIMVITPTLKDDIQDCQVKFRYRSNAAANAVLTVGVMEDWSNSADFKFVESFETNGSTNWSEPQLINFSKYEGIGKHIAFTVSGNDAGVTHTMDISDIEIIYIPACATPYGITCISTDNSLEFDWKSGNDSDAEWQYILSENKITIIEETTFEDLLPYALKADTVSTTHCLIGELDKNITYYFYVASMCGAIYPSAIEATTVCGAISIPYVENFKGYGNGTSGGRYSAFPDCWSRMSNLSTTISHPYIELVNKDIPSLYISSSNTAYSIAVTPKLKVELEDMQSLRITFRALRTTSSAPLYIGTMSDPENIETFKEIQTISLGSSQTWYDYEIKLNGLDIEGKYIAFYAKQLEACRVYITDLVIEEDIDCYIPSNITIAERTSDSFTLNWAAKGSNAKWEVVYGEYGFDINEHVGPGTIVYDASYKASGLSKNTYYDVYIRAICDEYTTSWSYKLTLVTLQEPENIPFKIDFETEEKDENWTLANANSVNKWSIGTAAYSEGSRGLYISDDNGATNSFNRESPTYTFAYRTINATEGKYGISFDWKSGGGVGAYMRVFLVPEDVIITPEWNNYITSTASERPNNWISVGDIMMEDVPTWQKQNYTWTVTENMAGRYNLVFYWTNGSSSYVVQPAAAIDNIVVTAPCTTPTNLYASNISKKSAALTWMNYNSLSWDVKVFDHYVIPQNVGAQTDPIYDETIEDNPIADLEGILDAGTIYYYYIKADCQDEWVGSHFMTLCEPFSIPFTDDFDSYNSSSDYIGCWRKISYGTDAYPTLSTAVSRSAPASLHLSGGNSTYSMAITPALDVSDMNSLYIEFMGRGTNTQKPGNNHVVIGILDDPEDYLTFEPIDTVRSLSTSFTQYRRFIQGYEGTGKYIGILAPDTSLNFFYIDDLRINCYENQEISDNNACANTDYDDHGFKIDKSEIPEPGTYTFYRTEHNPSGCDKIITFILTVKGTFHSYEASICEGEVYDENGFYETEEGTYRILSDNVDGCQGVLELHLIVNKEKITNQSASCCEAQLPYLWRGKELYDTDIYYDTIQSSTQCDSILVLDFTVGDYDTETVEITICSNESYFFDGAERTETGKYTGKFTSINGCDSTVILDLTVNKADTIYKDAVICEGTVFNGYGFTGLSVAREYRSEPTENMLGCDSVFVLNLMIEKEINTFIRDSICEGHTYNKYGFNKNSAGFYRDTLEAVGGCDSIITLQLIIIDIPDTYDELTIDKLPHDYNGEIIPEGTESGVIDITFTSVLGCDSIVHLDLTVNIGGTGIFNHESETFHLIPNPVKLGDKVLVEYDFTKEEQDGLQMEIYNNSGKRIYQYQPEYYPISIGENIDATGVYIIRIITGTNKVLIGKLIVI